MPIADDFCKKSPLAMPVERGPDFATWLATHLSDVEFELLVRKRVKRLFDDELRKHPNLDTAYSSCRYVHNFTDKSQWHVAVGENYRMRAEQEGEVLSITVAQSVKIMQMREDNKISGLLTDQSNGELEV